jgi:hypothetical protein
MFLANYYRYLSNYFSQEQSQNHQEIKSELDDDFVKIGFVSIKDLKSVNLTPIREIIPNPSRNAPPCFSKVDLRNLNRAQLNCIMNVKLRPIPPPLDPKLRMYEVRHPCLRELLKKRHVIY